MQGGVDISSSVNRRPTAPARAVDQSGQPREGRREKGYARVLCFCPFCFLARSYWVPVKEEGSLNCSTSFKCELQLFSERGGRVSVPPCRTRRTYCRNGDETGGKVSNVDWEWRKWTYMKPGRGGLTWATRCGQ